MRATLLILLLALGSCCVRHLGSSHVQEITTVESIPREIIVYDTVRHHVTPQRDSVIVAQCDTSHLENRYARSTAMVTPRGLHHTLETKAQSIVIPTQTRVEWRDTIIERTRHERIVVEVERQRTTFERVQIAGFWVLLLLFILATTLLLRPN